MAVYIQWQPMKEYFSLILIALIIGDELILSSFSKVDFTQIE